MIIREFTKQDIGAMIRIWNEVVEEGVAFPQEDYLDMVSGEEFFSSQSYTGVAEADAVFTKEKLERENGRQIYDKPRCRNNFNSKLARLRAEKDKSNYHYVSIKGVMYESNRTESRY